MVKSNLHYFGRQHSPCLSVRGGFCYLFSFFFSFLFALNYCYKWGLTTKLCNFIASWSNEIRAMPLMKKASRELRARIQKHGTCSAPGVWVRSFPPQLKLARASPCRALGAAVRLPTSVGNRRRGNGWESSAASGDGGGGAWAQWSFREWGWMN